MPRQGGLYKKDGDGKAQLVKATSVIKRDRHNRVVNPDKDNQALGRDAMLKAGNRPVSRPEPAAATESSADTEVRKSAKAK